MEDCVRCCVEQVGSQNALWPLASEYLAGAVALSVWSALHGHDFPGVQYPSGALILYRPKLKKSKLGAKTKPGLFMGCGIEAGVNGKGFTKQLASTTSVHGFLERPH